MSEDGDNGARRRPYQVWVFSRQRQRRSRASAGGPGSTERSKLEANRDGFVRFREWKNFDAKFRRSGCGGFCAKLGAPSPMPGWWLHPLMPGGWLLPLMPGGWLLPLMPGGWLLPFEVEAGPQAAGCLNCLHVSNNNGIARTAPNAPQTKETKKDSPFQRLIRKVLC